VKHVGLILASDVRLHVNLLRWSLADHDTLVDCILEAAGSLERGGVHGHRFGIQIVQIGTNPATANALDALRADLEGICVCLNLALAYGWSNVTPRTSCLSRHLIPSKAYSTLNTSSRLFLDAFVRLSMTYLVTNHPKQDLWKVHNLGQHPGHRPVRL